MIRSRGLRGKIWNRLGLDSAWWLQTLITQATRTYGSEVYAGIKTISDRGDNRRNLALAECRVFSQNGEDGVINEIMRRIGTETRYFVEFGVQDGSEGNCVFLGDIMGWKGLFIEADDIFFTKLYDKYRYSTSIKTAKAFVIPSNIEDIFKSYSVPRNLDVLSIDIDGNDYWVLKAIEDYRPRLLVVEYNSSLDPNSKLVQQYTNEGWKGTRFFGASLGAMVQLAKSKGYNLVYTDLTGVNAFFVREDLCHDLFDLDEIVVRSPNYFFRHQHAEDPHHRHYVNVDE